MADRNPDAPRGHLVGGPDVWPKWRYGPDGQAAIFQRPEDVPEGWTDGGQPPAPKPVVAAPVAPPAPPPDDKATESVTLTRAQICADLDERGIAYSKNAPTKALYNKLMAELDK